MLLTWGQLIAFGLGAMMLGVMGCFSWLSILLTLSFRDDPTVGLFSGFAGFGSLLLAMIFFMFALVL